MLLPHSAPFRDSNVNTAKASVLSILRASDFFLLSSPHYNCHYKINNTKLKGDGGGSTGGGKSRLYAELSFWERVGWALDHTFSLRGIGYSCQAAKVPEALRNVSRLRFVGELLGYYLFNDVAMSYLHWFCYEQIAGMEETRFRDLPLHQRLVASWAGCLSAICSICFPYAMIGLVFLGNWGDPGDFRPLTGPWRNAYTVRNFWGRVWHQALRRVLLLFPYPLSPPICNPILSLCLALTKPRQMVSMESVWLPAGEQGK